MKVRPTAASRRARTSRCRLSWKAHGARDRRARRADRDWFAHKARWKRERLAGSQAGPLFGGGRAARAGAAAGRNLGVPALDGAGRPHYDFSYALLDGAGGLVGCSVRRRGHNAAGAAHPPLRHIRAWWGVFLTKQRQRARAARKRAYRNGGAYPEGEGKYGWREQLRRGWRRTEAAMFLWAAGRRHNRLYAVR